MIGNCDACDRKNVPVSNGRSSSGETTQCYLCRGDTNSDPYFELKAMTETEKQIIEEAYKRFPDVVEPSGCHPAGKIVVDNGNLRYAFVVGAEYGANVYDDKIVRRFMSGPDWRKT